MMVTQLHEDCDGIFKHGNGQPLYLDRLCPQLVASLSELTVTLVLVAEVGWEQMSVGDRKFYVS